MGSLFGGSKSTTESGNHAYGAIQSDTAPYIQNGMDSNNLIQQLLSGGSINGTNINNFLANTPGYQFALDSGNRAINGSQAAKGMLNSGSTLRGLTQFGQQLGTNTYQNYMDNLLKQATLGVTSQGILSDAGKYSTQTQTSSPGIGGLLGGLLLMGATGGLGGVGLGIGKGTLGAVTGA